MKLILAPMEGVVDANMRKVLTALGGIDWCVSEFLRVTDRVLTAREIAKLIPEMHTHWRVPGGTVIYPQILGGRPEWMARNAEFLVQLGAPGVDLNFGCPAPTVNRHDGGAAILKIPSRVEAIVGAVRAAVGDSCPVTAKIRLGFDHKNDFLKIARAAEQGGAAWLTVHARSKTDGYKAPAYWEYIAQIRESVRIPVIANGDIWNLADFQRCAEVTGCDQFMIGRGAIARPQIFQEILLQREMATWRDTAPMFFEFAQASPVSRCKQWLKYLSRTFAEAAEIFEEVKRIDDKSEFLIRISEGRRADLQYPKPLAPCSPQSAFH